jgi:hypothetical protein
MKSPAKLLALSAALTAMVTSAYADGVVQFGANNANYRQGQGGEFNLTVIKSGPVGGPNVIGADYDHLLNDYPTITPGNGAGSGTLVAGGFETFCLQKTEYMNFNTQFWYSTSSAAKTATVGYKDEISVGTSYLYAQFAQGTLTGYIYKLGTIAGQPSNLDTRAETAEMLQHAFWFLEDEEDYATAGGVNNIFLNQVLSLYGSFGTSTTGAKKDATGLNMGVGVINLATTAANAAAGKWDAQDQLIWPRPVPEQNATVALLGLALAGLAGFRRKFSK